MDFGKKYTHYSEGIYVGYRYYQKAGAPVRFPFGYGLSYTSFAYNSLKIEDRRVMATVTNTGIVPGAEIVQLYVAAPQDGLYRPVRELKGFVKIFLEPGESREVVYDLDDRSFAVWANGWKVPGGTYTVELGASSADIRLCGELSVQGEEISVPAWQKGSWYETPYGLPTDEDFEALFNGSIQPEPVIKRGSFTMEMSCMEMKDVSPIMNSMFNYAEAFNQPLDKWDVSNVGDMYRMFFNAESFNQQLDKWQVTDRTVTSDMFVGSNLKSLPEWFR